MGAKKAEVKPLKFPRTLPASTPEGEEQEMIALATALAKQQLLDGTASAQVITHYLKLGTTREMIEKEILEKQKDLLVAKTEALESQKRVEELYADAMTAFRDYSGKKQPDDEDYYE